MKTKASDRFIANKNEIPGAKLFYISRIQGGPQNSFHIRHMSTNNASTVVEIYIRWQLMRRNVFSDCI